jgi:hypothetical protein
MPAHDGSIAVGGQGGRPALFGSSDRAGADQFAALLGPDTTAAGVDPRSSDVRVIVRRAHDGSVAIGRQGDAVTLEAGPNRLIGDQLVALLGPNTIVADEDPRRPGIRVVGKPAQDGGVTVGGQRDGVALLGGSDRQRADKFRPLLDELRPRRLR